MSPSIGSVRRPDARRRRTPGPPRDHLRARLLRLYAAARPVFVADAYARRVLVRHRLLRRGAGYDEARAFLEARLPSEPVLFNEFHALLVRVGKTHCRTVPRCEGCPLRFDLQSRGPAR